MTFVLADYSLMAFLIEKKYRNEGVILLRREIFLKVIFEKVIFSNCEFWQYCL